jgi:hypothetical protein
MDEEGVNPDNLQEKSTSRIFAKYTKKRLILQRIIGRISLLTVGFFIVFLFKFVCRYKIEDVKKTRAQFKEIIKENTPLLICANHLTFIDSCLIIWALGGGMWYLFHYRYFSWNLPAGDFFGSMPLFRIMGFLNKCIFIHRDASSDHHNEILNICKNLLMLGEVITIFPEGKRSRSGLFEHTKMTYGVGKILVEVPHCRVLSLYMRSDKQVCYSNYPALNSNFLVKMEVMKPTTDKKGREAVAHLVSQIAESLKKLEDRYFEARPRPG